MKSFAVVFMLMALVSTQAFTISKSSVSSISSKPAVVRSYVNVKSTPLYSTEGDVTEETVAASTPVPTEPETSYPLNVPSPILLASSMVLAIISTGSVFELSGGSPVLGFAPTLGITIVGVPTCFFLFYASIKKAQAETEEDDKAYRNRNNRF
ncbi:hypothetical protein CTEN210_00252 [Chaetoceros tenuissimus]|uniref:Uncharacterized protein n=1 Tax=Chaetoceros tenuissimus TaxID=426638 RepID=A0AAD3CDS1_9STRA|nr:hypothetical protein CTEN210_00252 [Chaetoceros tenuissimus]